MGAFDQLMRKLQAKRAPDALDDDSVQLPRSSGANATSEGEQELQEAIRAALAMQLAAYGLHPPGTLMDMLTMELGNAPMFRAEGTWKELKAIECAVHALEGLLAGTQRLLWLPQVANAIARLPRASRLQMPDCTAQACFDQLALLARQAQGAEMQSPDMNALAAVLLTIKRQSAEGFAVAGRKEVPPYADLAGTVGLRCLCQFSQATYLHCLVDPSRGRCKALSAIAAHAVASEDRLGLDRFFAKLQREMQRVRETDFHEVPAFAAALGHIDEGFLDFASRLPAENPRSWAGTVDRLSKKSLMGPLLAFSPNHCMMLARTADKDIVFFDPNFGAFAGSPDRMKTFLERYFSKGLGAL